MKTILKTTLKLSAATFLAFKAGDLTYRKYQLFSRPSNALYEDTSDDIMSSLLRTEFTGDLSKVPYEYKAKFDFKLKSRDENMKELTDPKNIYDILIIGGGSSGAGVALETASRGLKCAVIDSYDFSSGTSSKSTKMAHGGIRYFEKMMKLEGDPFLNYRLLRETLHERNYFLYCAPYMNKQLDLLIPSKSLLQSIFFYYPGCMLYHLIYLKQLMSSNYEIAVDGPKIMSRKKLK